MPLQNVRRLSVCLSFCLCVMIWYCVKTAKHIVNIRIRGLERDALYKSTFYFL